MEYLTSVWLRGTPKRGKMKEEQEIQCRHYGANVGQKNPFFTYKNTSYVTINTSYFMAENASLTVQHNLYLIGH